MIRIDKAVNELLDSIQTHEEYCRAVNQFKVGIVKKEKQMFDRIHEGNLAVSKIRGKRTKVLIMKKGRKYITVKAIEKKDGEYHYTSGQLFRVSPINCQQDFSNPIQKVEGIID